MASLVFLYNKKYNKTYVYESINYWDKSEKKSKSKRKLIGIKDPVTGEILPTSTRKKKMEEDRIKQEKLQSEKRKFYGATFLLNQIASKLGVTSSLRQCFPDSYKEILSVAQYLLLERDSPISRFEKWNRIHRTAAKEGLTSQRISEMFSEIEEHNKNMFFRLMSENLKEDEHLAYDTTSISSYSKMINQMKYGYNKENDTLAQINLAILYGEKSALPFYYRVLPGNIVDVSTVKRLIEDIRYLKIRKPKLVMDRGFFSRDNIDRLIEKRFKFIVGTKSTKLIKERVEKVKDIKKFTNYLVRLRTDIENNVENESRQEDYRKYFDIEVEKGNIVAIPKEEEIEKHTKNYGYFSLISNENLEVSEVLNIYRQKDVAEKAFHNIKDRLDTRRVRVSSKPTLDGKIFVTFVSLILLSYIKNQMKRQELYKKYTTQELLDELDIIESYEREGEKLRLGEITKKQREIFEKLEIRIPEELL